MWLLDHLGDPGVLKTAIVSGITTTTLVTFFNQVGYTPAIEQTRTITYQQQQIADEIRELRQQSAETAQKQEKILTEQTTAISKLQREMVEVKTYLRVRSGCTGASCLTQ